MANFDRALCWFRRDLRLHDHAALYHALKQSKTVYCVFIFDTDILDKLVNKQDRRVEFIWQSLRELQQRLHAHDSTLIVLHGKAQETIPQLAKKLAVQTVFCNHDYQLEAIQRDAAVETALVHDNITFHHFKDQVIFEGSELLTSAGKPFSVFTPYKNAWLKKVNDFYLRAYPTERYFSSLAKGSVEAMPNIESLGFEKSNLTTLNLSTGESGAQELFFDFTKRIDDYHESRNFPGIKGVSYLSTHLRFGTISIRQLASYAYHAGSIGAETWLSELIWRDFYQMLLSQHPHLATGKSYKPQFNNIPFSNDKEKFEAWCNASTGFPLVDAAMRQLNQTGYMHNRLRMITASFLVKDLHIDWRWGEHYFAQHLLDFDLAANNGGWQWAASTGCDAQPWFRIFNPVTQSEKFDPKGKFIRRYLPELTNCPDKWIHAPWLMPEVEQQKYGIIIGKNYPGPIVDHGLARIKTLRMFQAAN